MKPATFPSEQVALLPPVVAEIGQIHFEGNIIRILRERPRHSGRGGIADGAAVPPAGTV